MEGGRRRWGEGRGTLQRVTLSTCVNGKRCVRASVSVDSGLVQRCPKHCSVRTGNSVLPSPPSLATRLVWRAYDPHSIRTRVCVCIVSVPLCRSLSLSSSLSRSFYAPGEYLVIFFTTSLLSF